LFDIEYDKYGSWTSKTALDIYQVTRNKKELEAFKKYQSIKEGNTKETVEEDTGAEEIILDSNSIDVDKLIKAIDSSVSKGDVRLGIKVDGEIMFYKNLVSKKLITKFLG